MNHYQLIIIGGGPGGLEAARFGAQNGLKTALIYNIGTMQPQNGSAFKTLDWSGNLKAAFNDYAPGLIRVRLEETTGRILGAAAFGYQARRDISAGPTGD